MKVFKSILKCIGKVLTYGFLIIIFFVGIFVDKAEWFYGISTGVLLILGIRIIIHIIKCIKVKEKYIRRAIALIINGFLFLSILDFMVSYEEYKGEVLNSLAEEYIKSAESEEYNNGFEEVNYRNYKILYNENSKEAINLIQRYLDEVEEDSKRLFNIESTSALTIKFDYDENVFKNRNNLSENTLGYYIYNNKTIYIYVKDAYEILSDKDHFKNRFFHEYTHHYMRECLDFNNIDESKIPTWFNEGVANYIGHVFYFPIKCVHGLKFEFIPFRKMQNRTDWRDFGDGSNYVQSEYMINKMVEKKNEDVILQLILKLNDVSFEDAFKEVVGHSLDEFEEEIENDIKNSEDICTCNY